MFPERRLSELCSEVVDCPHSTPTWTQDGVLVLRSHNIRGGHLNLTERSFTDEEHYRQRIRRAEPMAGDLVITREAPMGEICIIPPGLRCCLGQRMVLLRPNRELIDGTFLLFAMQSREVQLQIRAHEGTGSTVSNLRIPALESLQIPWPEMREQQGIARILGTIDDKIELNRRTNHTLEAAARAIFKSWFIDFDPVVAKAAGRKPVGMSAETARLFPKEFEDSKLGPIPKGWRVGSLLDLAKLLSGGTPKTTVSEYWNGDIPWASAGDVSQCPGCFLITTSRSITSRGLAESATRIIEPWSTVIVARGATTGRLAMFGKPIAMNQTCYGLRSHEECHATLYCHLRETVDGLLQAAYGSVFDTITTNTFGHTEVVLAGSHLVRSCESLIKPLFEGILLRQQQSVALHSIRNALLPKLLVGELRVKEAEKILQLA